jgi:hypothetical protein
MTRFLGILFVHFVVSHSLPMKKILATGVPVLLCLALQAQSFDDIIYKRQYVSCNDVSYNAPELIHSLHGKGETDSLYQFLDYWESKCGSVEYITAIRTVLDIKTANFDSAVVTEELLASLMQYKENGALLDYPGYRNELAQLHQNLQKETRAIAADVQQTYSADEALLIDFFKSDQASFANMKQATARDSKLKKLYDKKITETLRIPQMHVAGFASYYQPFGKLDVFGPHAGIGGLFGINQLRHTLDLAFDIRFGRSASEYQFVYQGNLMQDDRWTSAYIGLEYTYDFYSGKKFKAGISPGVAYNGVTAVPADDDDDDPRILPALDVSAGLSFKYTVSKRGAYAGLQTRYHWVDHRNAGGTELTGSYLSVRLIFGSIFNYQREYYLSQLEY